MKQTHALFSFQIKLKRKFLKFKFWAIGTCCENKLRCLREESALSQIIFISLFSDVLFHKCTGRMLDFSRKGLSRYLLYKINSRGSKIRVRYSCFQSVLEKKKLGRNSYETNLFSIHYVWQITLKLLANSFIVNPSVVFCWFNLLN